MYLLGLGKLSIRENSRQTMIAPAAVVIQRFLGRSRELVKYRKARHAKLIRIAKIAVMTFSQVIPKLAKTKYNANKPVAAINA